MLGRQRRRSPLAGRLRQAHDVGPGVARHLGGSVGGPVVGDDHRGAREGLADGAHGLPDAIGLVPGGDDDGDRGGVHSAGYGARPLRSPCIWRRSVPDIEAHITGTVWKIECQVGDTIAEGDTVVILESMKMEMPVEAEDEGTVKEILCEEGQAVNEGDTLVVLE